MNEQRTPTTRHHDGWLGADIKLDEIAYDFTPEHLAAIDTLMERIRVRGLQLEEIERKHFEHPAINAFLAEIVTAMKTKSGIVMLRGFPVNRYDLDEMQCIYWGVGTHFGKGCSQSSAGDLLGHVTDRKSSRGYTSSRALVLHCDATEISALLCIRTAKQGGKNILASSLKVHEIVQKEHPEYMPILERGFPYHRRGEEKPGAEPISPYNVPIFSNAAGVLSCRYAREMFEPAIRDLGRTLTPLELAAVDFFDEVAQRKELRFELHLEPGEAIFLNNFEVLHSRTSFVDWDEPDRKRLLYRLWLEGEPLRPICADVLFHRNDSGRQGIDRQAAKPPGLSKYEPVYSAKYAPSEN